VLGKVTAVTDFTINGTDSVAGNRDGVVLPECVAGAVSAMPGMALTGGAMSAAKPDAEPGSCSSVLNSGEATGD